MPNQSLSDAFNSAATARGWNPENLTQEQKNQLLVDIGAVQQGNMSGFEQALTNVVDWFRPGSANSAGSIGYTKAGTAYDISSIDSQVNAENVDVENAREAANRQEAYHRDDTAMARLAEQLQGIGINPALYFSSGGPVSNSASYNTASTKSSNTAATGRNEQTNNAKIFAAIIAALGMLATKSLVGTKSSAKIASTITKVA